MKLNQTIARKYIERYYEALNKFKHHQADNESTTETAFKDLLHNLSLDLNLTLVKTTEKKKQNDIIPDGIIKDDYFRVVGYWEAKDTKDDLDDEIYKKLKLGYPRINTIFEDTQTAVLYQDSSEFDRYNLKDEDQLVELLIQFFNYNEPVYEQFRQAVEKFKENISRLSEDFKSIIHKSKKVNSDFREAVAEFLTICASSFHRDITEDDVEDMLIQHLLTERIFRKVFDNPEFSSNNVIAVQLEKLISILTKHAFNKAKFFEHTNQYYVAIEEEAAQFDDFSEKQAFLNKIYEAFFQSYSKKNADKNGIVYTPQSIVKFMVKFTEDVLQSEFEKSLSSKGVNIIDPCTGTGNFVMEILRNIEKPKLPYKYKNEMFANELMLLPYYVASANIEHYYYERTKKYEPFENIVFTDTLELIEDPNKDKTQGSFEFIFNEANSERAKRQLASDLFVIIGNPPYNASQESENENNKNTKNEIIDDCISKTYAKESKAQLKNKLYDPYIKFVRWASDRLNKQNGIVCFITNNSFMNDIQFDGMRKLLLKDFHRIYHFDLGGDVYLNPSLSGTKHNVFGIKLGVGISFFIRNNNYSDHLIFKHSLEEYLTRYEKEEIITGYRLNNEHLSDLDWTEGYLDKSNNYIFDDAEIETTKEYEKFIPLFVDDENDDNHIFKTKYPGISTNRNEWVYSFFENDLEEKMKTTIKFYNEEVSRFEKHIKQHKISNISKFNIDNFVDNDLEKIKWSSGLKQNLKTFTKTKFSQDQIIVSSFRPFVQKYLYYDNTFVDRPSRYFELSSVENLYLCTSGLGSKKVSSFVSNLHPNLDMVEKTQVFPLVNVYKSDSELISESNITDWAIKYFRTKAKISNIKSSDIFNYCYAMLHHQIFLSTYQKDLQRSSPRIPLLPKHFKSISLIGKKFILLHLNYSNIKITSLKPVPETREFLKTTRRIDYSIEKLKISRDKSILTYNKELEFYIPEDAWGYEVNGRTPLEWIVDQYKDYPATDDEILKLIGRCITVTKNSKLLIDELSKIKIN